MGAVDSPRPCEEVMAKKHDACAEIDLERLLADLQSPDEDVRGDAVRSLCPCHAGWEVFEQHVLVVQRLMRDRSRAVRAQALHVFEDAARMQLARDINYFLQDVEEAARKKLASRFPHEDAERVAARKIWIKRREKGGAVRRNRPW